MSLKAMAVRSRCVSAVSLALIFFSEVSAGRTFGEGKGVSLGKEKVSGTFFLFETP